MLKSPAAPPAAPPAARPLARLTAIIRDLECFTSVDGQAFARFSVPASGGFYILPLRSRAFRHWLLYQFYTRHDSQPTSQAVNSVLDLLEAQANLHLDSAQRLIVGRRVTTSTTAHQIILDLADSDARFVEISPGFWNVTAGPGVLLQTSRSTMSLPQPVASNAGAPSPLDTLRSSLNCNGSQYFPA